MNISDASLPARRPIADAAKRGMDILGSGLLLLVLSPLMVALAVCVRLSSPGPIFFRQQRVGREGQLFLLYKFRSMHIASGGPAVTADGDSRITPVGRVMRKTKLDELPQFWNVLRGDMSLVGPRPEVPEYVYHYTQEQRQVLSVRPGITGISQVEFRDEERLLAGREDVEVFYLNTVMPAKLALDLRYVRERTLLGDLLLLLRTVVAIVGRSPHRASEPLAADCVLVSAPKSRDITVDQDRGVITRQKDA